MSQRTPLAVTVQPHTDHRAPTIANPAEAARRGIAAGVLLLGALALLSTDDGPVLCPYRICTGGYCPGCGLTRAGGHMLRRRFAASWAQHPYMILLAAQLPFIALAWIGGLLKAKSGITAVSGTILGVNFALLIGIWVVRMVSGDIPLPF